MNCSITITLIVNYLVYYAVFSPTLKVLMFQLLEKQKNVIYLNLKQRTITMSMCNAIRFGWLKRWCRRRWNWKYHLLCLFRIRILLRLWLIVKSFVKKAHKIYFHFHSNSRSNSQSQYQQIKIKILVISSMAGGDDERSTL